MTSHRVIKEASFVFGGLRSEGPEDSHCAITDSLALQLRLSWWPSFIKMMANYCLGRNAEMVKMKVFFLI